MALAIPVLVTAFIFCAVPQGAKSHPNPDYQKQDDEKSGTLFHKYIPRQDAQNVSLPVPVTVNTTSNETIIGTPGAPVFPTASAGPVVLETSSSPTYVFPSTTAVVPFATVCPINLSYGGMGNGPNTSPSNGTYSNSTLPSAGAALPLPVNGTDIYPAGPTVGGGGPRLPPSPPLATGPVTSALLGRRQAAAAATAPAVSGDTTSSVGEDGCTTLESKTTTASCYTVIPEPGNLPLTVTDCYSWLTFSSSTMAPASGPFATPLGSFPPGSGPGPVINSTGPYSNTTAGNDTSLPPLPPITNVTDGSNTTILPRDSSSDSAKLPPIPLQGGVRIAYFAAPWTQLAYTPLTPPPLVSVTECIDLPSNHTEYCPPGSTHLESWSVVNVTSTKLVTKTVTFEGEITPPAQLGLNDESGDWLSLDVTEGVSVVVSTEVVQASSWVTQSISRSVVGEEGEGGGLPVVTMTTDLGGGAGGAGSATTEEVDVVSATGA
ncbi:MAG: hypothetical protein Q9227_001713 [Pyrenula ochraceoflavens]